jgi:Glycosyl-transferase for dystroglycan
VRLDCQTTSDPSCRTTPVCCTMNLACLLNCAIKNSAAASQCDICLYRAEATDSGCQLTITLHTEAVADAAAAAQLFPANALRNAALLTARTQLVLVLDGDMLVAPALSTQLANPAGCVAVYMTHFCQAFVLAHFCHPIWCHLRMLQ